MSTGVQNSYGFGTPVALPYRQTVERVREALQTEGFGVLTEIDVQQTLRSKLGIETAPYLILGACNPPLAHQALSIEPQIGLLLPCNVTIRVADDGTTRVDIADPEVLLGIAHNVALLPFAAEARARLQRVLATLPTAPEAQPPVQ